MMMKNQATTTMAIASQDSATSAVVQAEAPLTIMPRLKVIWSLQEARQAFLRELQAKNRSQATIHAYGTDLNQFFSWLSENNLVAERPDQVERADITEYLAELGSKRVSGVSRARKLAAIREYFRFLLREEQITRSPVEGVETPKKERNIRPWLQPEEYRGMLAQAGANPRDYAILQTFLQTGIRLKELCDLRVFDVDVKNRLLSVKGKGMVAREIELEPKAIKAIKSYLELRKESLQDQLFLNRYGQPISPRGVQKLVTRYRQAAGITKRAGCHSLRHTFGTIKAQKGVSPFQLKEWLGHANLNTTQIYVHMAKGNGRKVMEGTSL